MPHEDERVQEAARWMRFARDDLASARLHLATQVILPNQASYHAQQAAEKALKALLILRGIVFPRTHDLLALAALLPAEAAGVAAGLDLALLTSWAVSARYPTDLPEATPTSAAEAIAVAEALCARMAASESRLS